MLLMTSIVPSTLKTTKKDAKKEAKKKSVNEDKPYTLWKFGDWYSKTTKDKEDGVGLTYHTLEDKINQLENWDYHYHDRIDPTKQYIFYADIDKASCDFKMIRSAFEYFFDDKKYSKYDLRLKDFSYTENKEKKEATGLGSYHFTIPRVHALPINQRAIMEEFKKFVSKKDSRFCHELKGTSIDLTIYGSGFFRCVNQSKPKSKADTKAIGIHVIKQGEMKDFIIDHIDNDSEDINHRCVKQETSEEEIEPEKEEKSNKKSLKNALTKTTKKDKEDTSTTQVIEVTEEETLNESKIIRRLIEECILLVENDSYDCWLRIGMSLNNHFGNDGFELFELLSNKRTWVKYKNGEIKAKYDSFKKNQNKGITIGTLYFIAKEHNEAKYFEIIGSSVNYDKIDSTTVSKLIAMLRPDHFIWKGKKIYCYTGIRWVQDESELIKYIANDLHLFLTKKLMSMYKGKEYLEKVKKVEKLRSDKFIEATVKMSRVYLTNDEVEFDSKWNLLGFTNLVLDLQTFKFREYQFDDYVTMTTGYKWFEPEQEEIDKVNEIISSIHSNEEIRNYFLELVSTALDGKPLEKFIILNGGGRNGKGLFNDLFLKALGNYGLIGNCALLFEKAKSGANPEKANIDKKRLVIFREPPKDSKIENSAMKELTGGGTFSSRACHENTTQKTLCCTVMCECNNKLLLKEPPSKAEYERHTEIKYENTFTFNPEEVDEDNGIYLASDEYKTNEFQDSHKRALIAILLVYYQSYVERGRKFITPKAIKDNNDSYLKESSDIYSWIDSRYVFTNDEDNFESISNIYEYFKLSPTYENSTMKERRSGDFTTTNFKEAVKSNLFIKRDCIFKDRFSYTDDVTGKKKQYRSVLLKIRMRTLEELAEEDIKIAAESEEETFIRRNT